MRVRADGRFPVGSMVWRRRPDVSFVTVVCAVTHVLAPDRSPLAAEQPPPRDADVPWDEHGASLWAPSDIVPRKRGVDVIVGGHAFAAGGAPVTSLTARLVVGAINKAVVVRGDRFWTPDDRLTAAEPFTSMPLRWELAGGGPGTWNPVGVPPDPPSDESGLRRAPNLLLPRVTLASPSQEVAPACLGAIAPAWPERTSKLGPHARTWRHDRWAAEPVPDDVDWAYFNAAPPDQRLDAVGPSIALVLEHLHAEHAMLLTELAPATPKAFVKRGKGAPMELPLVCDTLWIDSYRGTCTLTFRGFMRLLHRDEEGEILVTEGAEPGSRVWIPDARHEGAAAAGAPEEEEEDESASTLVARAVSTSTVEELAEDDVLEEDEDEDEIDESASTLVGPAAIASDEAATVRPPPPPEPPEPLPALPSPREALLALSGSPPAPEPPPARPGALVLGSGMLSGVKLGAAPRRGFFADENSTGTFAGVLSPDAREALPFKTAVGGSPAPPLPAAGAPAPALEDATRTIDLAALTQAPAAEDTTRTIDLAALTRAAAPVPFHRAQTVISPPTEGAAQPALPFQRAQTAVAPPAEAAAPPALPFQRAQTAVAPPAEAAAQPALPFSPAPAPEPAPIFRRAVTWQPAASLKPALPFGNTDSASLPPAAPSVTAAPAAPFVTAAPPVQPVTASPVEPAERAAEAPHPLDPPPLPPGKFAEIKAEIWLAGGLSEVLSRHGIDEVEWRAEERRQASSIAAEMSEGKGDLALALADALREARNRAREKRLTRGGEAARALGEPP